MRLTTLGNGVSMATDKGLVVVGELWRKSCGRDFTSFQPCWILRIETRCDGVTFCLAGSAVSLLRSKFKFGHLLAAIFFYGRVCLLFTSAEPVSAVNYKGLLTANSFISPARRPPRYQERALPGFRTERLSCL